MEIKKEVLEKHKQLTTYSCIPMSVEFILKLIGKFPLEDFRLQESWNDRKDGDFEVFNGQIIEGVKFTRHFSNPRDNNFPIEQLFNKIDNELIENRYVIIALSVPEGFHNYIIYNKINGEYQVTTTGRPKEEINVQEIVKKIKGTDILTYEILYD
ncbi:MAG: hypothetical protein K8R68_12355 [Bacteroidales bacterium]|nr:hypothetical protein [Bacteroidales bacterium]